MFGLCSWKKTIKYRSSCLWSMSRRLSCRPRRCGTMFQLWNWYVLLPNNSRTSLITDSNTAPSSCCDNKDLVNFIILSVLCCCLSAADISSAVELFMKSNSAWSCFTEVLVNTNWKNVCDWVVSVLVEMAETALAVKAPSNNWFNWAYVVMGHRVKVFTWYPTLWYLFCRHGCKKC